MHRIPNFLTKLRMALTPAWLGLLGIALCYPTTPHFWQAFAMLSFLAITDKADGWLARCRGGRWKSDWGAVWDPIADKGLFWTSIVLICVWMTSQVGSSPNRTHLLVATFCTAATNFLAVRHIQLDYQSTKLRGKNGEGAKRLGQMKFAMDLLALALALLGAWSMHRNPYNIIYAYGLIMLCMALSVRLATMNVNLRRATVTPST